MRKIPKLKKLHINIKIQYYINCAASLVSIASGAFFVAINCDVNTYNDTHRIANSVFLFSYLVLLLGIQNIFLFRLHYTFRESVHRLTSNQLRILSILFISMNIFACACFVFYNLYLFDPANFSQFGYLLMFVASGIGGLLYIIATIYELYLFAKKLLILTQTSATSMKNVMDENALKLNKTQTKLLDRTSRYVSLIILAMISSFITIILFISLNTPAIIFSFFDCTVNVICLYLQYPFATKYYDKYCGWINKCLNKILTNNVQKNLERKYRDSEGGDHDDTKKSKSLDVKVQTSEKM